jgi:hypothetical protein
MTDPEICGEIRTTYTTHEACLLHDGHHGLCEFVPWPGDLSGDIVYAVPAPVQTLSDLHDRYIVLRGTRCSA